MDEAELDDMHLEEELRGSEVKKKLKKDTIDDCFDTGVYIRYIFIIFIIIWTLIISVNRLYKFAAFPILLIPYASFGLGIINSDEIADDNLEEDIFSTTFIAMGLIISMPLLSHFNKDVHNKDLSHIIFMAMVAILFSYFHIWVDISRRHVCKISRSCFETIAVTLYIFAVTIFFICT